MSIIVNGKNQAIRQPDSYRFDSIRGWQTVVRYLGTKSKIFELIPQFSSTGCTLDIFSTSGAKWELQASSPQALDGSVEAPVNVWESTANIITKDILSAPAASTISEADLSRINRWILNPPAPDAGGVVAEPVPALTGSALTALRLIKRGVGYIVSQPIVRHTQIVSNQYGSKLADTTYDGRILATVSIGAPSSFLVNLPGSGSGTSNIPGGSNFGWMQKRAQQQTAAYNKMQVVREFEYGEWSTFLYGSLV